MPGSAESPAAGTAREATLPGYGQSIACVVGGYVIVGSAWILITDLATAHLADTAVGFHAQHGALVHIIKGLLFVAVTAVLLYGMLRNAAARIRRREEALQDERARLRIVVDSIPDPLWLKDTDGVYRLCNRATLEILGQTDEAGVVGRSDFDFVPPELAQAIRASDRVVIEDGRSLSFEHNRWPQLAGQNLLFETARTPMRDATGKVIGVLGIARDITQQVETRRAIEERAALRTRLAHVVDSVPGVVCSFARHEDGRIEMLFVAGAVRHLYGLDAEQITGSIDSVNAHVHPDDLAGVLSSVDRSARSLDPWHHEWRYRHPERGPIWLEAHALPEREADGRIVWHGYLQDSTARKLEEERRALLLELTADFLQGRHDAAALAQRFFERIRRPLGADFFFNYRLAADRSCLGLVAIGGLPPEAEAEWQTIGFEDGFCGVVAIGAVQISADEAQIRVDPRAARLHALGLRAYVGCPLLAPDGRVLGTFSIASHERTSYDRAELDFLQTACQSLALAWQRIESEQALVASERTLIEAQSLAHLGSWTETADRRMTWSAEMHRILGVPFGAVPTAAAVMEAVHPDDRQIVLDADAVLRGGALHTCEFRVVVGGEIRWVRSRGRFLLDASGVPAGGIGTLQDITERVTMRQALERHQQHLEETVAERTQQLEAANRNLLEQGLAIADLYNRAPCGYHSLDAEGWIVAINDTELAWLGYRREEVLGRRRLIDLLTEDSKPRYRAAFAAFLERGSITDIDYELVRKDGSIMPATLSSILVCDAAGRFLWTRSTVVDATERRRRESEIAALNAELARRAHDAEAANRAKTAFLANMSHEIRTPMNAILGFTDLLSRSPRDPADGGRLAQIGEAARHLLSIIDDVLDLSKIEAGKLTLEVSDFDFEELVRQVCALFHDRAEAKGLELRLDIDAAPARVRGDATRLRQVLMNYLSNAVKFTERGSITTRVKTVNRATGTLTVRIEIEDTGIGVDEADQARLFEPFEQADGSTTRRFGGTGLGLAINRRLATLMGGQVGLRSRPGGGSCFWFTLQLGSLAAPLTGVHEPAELAGLDLLLVDDDSSSCAALAAMLESMELRVAALAAGGMEQALATALRADRNGRHFAAVVVTARGADGLGWRIASSLRTLPLRRRLPCLILRDGAHAVPGPGAVGAAADAQLDLPVTVAALRLALLRIVRQDRSGGTRRLAILAQEERLRTRHRGAHVLVAEDHPLNQRVACDMLQLAGLTYDVAANGREAVNLAQRGRYDLVLMDVHMPVMNGLDASTAIRQLTAYAHTPIIAMTADGFDEDLTHCRSAGMDDLLMKPVAAETFYAAIAHWLEVASVRGHTPAAGAGSEAEPATPTVAATDLERALECLPGVDAAEGLKFARGRISVYLELLHMFADPAHVGAAGLAGAATSGKLDELRQRAHALKGVAALIGATRVQVLATELEAAVRAGRPHTEIERGALAVDEEFALLAAAIRCLPAEEGTPTQGSAPPADAAVGRRLLDDLESALERSDFSAYELVQSNAATLHALLGSDAAALERHVSAFAFDAARRVLASARYSASTA